MLDLDKNAKSKILTITPAYCSAEIDCYRPLPNKEETNQNILKPADLKPLSDKTIALAIQLKKAWNQNDALDNTPNKIMILKPDREARENKIPFKELVFLCGLLTQTLKPNHLRLPSIEQWNE